MGDTSHRLTVAVEDEFERLKASDSQYFGATDQRRTRETASLVAEWRGRFGEAIDLGAAVRHDDSHRFVSATPPKDRKCVVTGKSVSDRVESGGSRIIKK